MSMNIQRFHAPTAREALALARATFGDDTLILSNRQLGDGVEVVAACEAELAALDVAGALQTAPTQPGGVAARGELPKSPAPVPTPKPAPAAVPTQTVSGLRPDASTQEVVRADTEQLSMSTLSFQDYVRERMLRRQHEAAHGSASKPAAAAAPAAAATPSEARGAFATAPKQAALPAAAAMPTAANLIAPSEAAAAPDAQRFSKIATDADPIAVPTAQVVTTARPAAIAATPLIGAEEWVETRAPQAAKAPAQPEASGQVMAELQAMKQLMEERFNTLSWLGQARQDPIHSNLMLKLVRAGYSPTLARSVLEPIAIGPDANNAVRAVMASLESRIDADPAAPSIAEEGGVFALIGATGVGKTTTVAKLAAQGVRLHGTSAVGLITLDTQRAGAHEQLRSFARSLGLVAHLAHDRAALQELLTLLSGKKLVLVDTAGIAPRDPRRRELLDLLDMPSIKRVMVLNAGAHGDTLDEMAASFKIGGTRQAILSKTDEANKLGPALDTVMRHELRLRGVAHGQRVPEDWKAANGSELVRESMRSTQRAPFDPRTPDIDFYFSPAACAV
ncbi:Flagellar biosynthesis protein FlhF [Burkholderiales bacterium 8X]|nr:Flagellar biosynthesis protein FlhF [Burkholderiales bacterium 8X]